MKKVTTWKLVIFPAVKLQTSWIKSWTGIN